MCPRFSPDLSQDKPGEIPGTNPGSSQDQPDKKVYVYVPFSCLTLALSGFPATPSSLLENGKQSEPFAIGPVQFS